MRRFEARIFRFWSEQSGQLGRFILVFWLLWGGLTGTCVTRTAFQNGPLDWSAQALSILTVGRLTFESAPRFIGAFDLILVALLAFVPHFRVTAVGLFARFVLAFLPLVMLQESLWSAFPAKPNGAGWGLLSYIAVLGTALLVAMRARWRSLQTTGTALLLYESDAQIARRKQTWRRFGLVFTPIALCVAVAVHLFWPHYLKWFHTRQEAGVLNAKMAGQLLRKSMPASAILGGRKITTWVYLPPGYSRSTGRYPVVYVMHGMPGEVRDCFVKGEIQNAAESLILSHRIRPLILVGWDGQGPGGPGDVTNYLDRPDYPMESFVLRELVPYVDRTYRTIPDARFRALDGISAGGYAAPNFLFKHPDVWKVASSHNGFFSPDDDSENMTAILGPRGPLWDENNPMKTVMLRGPQDNLHIYLDIGQGDDLQAEFSRFAIEIKGRGIDCNAHIYTGRHTWTYWSQHFYDSLLFADKSFGIEREAPLSSSVSPEMANALNKWQFGPATTNTLVNTLPVLPANTPLLPRTTRTRLARPTFELRQNFGR